MTASTAGASFADKKTGGSGSATWTGIKLEYTEGETVRINVGASNMGVMVHAEACANGKDLVKHIGAPGSVVEFQFQPREGRNRVSLRCVANPKGPNLASDSSAGVLWVFEPTGEAGGPSANLEAVDAQDVGAMMLARGGIGEGSIFDKYAKKVDSIVGVAADGVSLVVLRSPMESPGAATFDVSGAGGALYPLFGERPLMSEGVKQLIVNTRKMTDGKHIALALYRPPSYFGKGQDPKKIHFGVRTKAEGASDFGQPGKLTIDLVRPPVVLVHGTYDNPRFCYQDRDPEQDDAALNMGPQLANLGFRVSYLDWEEWNGSKNPSSFETNQSRVLQGVGGIQEALANMRQEHIAVTQADVVCHSQGGMIVRMFCRGYPFSVQMRPDHPHFTNPDKCREGSRQCLYHRTENGYAGDIHRLITISSTHGGSHVLNLFKVMAQYPDAGMRQTVEKLAANVFVCVVDNAVSRTDSDGVLNQIPGSLELQLMGPTPVPAHAIACVGTDENMKNDRPDSLTVPGSVPGLGNYWNKLFKIWIGTPDTVKDWVFERLAEQADAAGVKNLKDDVEEYKRLNKAFKENFPTLSLDLSLLNTTFQLTDPKVKEQFHQILNQMRKIVFERDKNDCTVALKSSLGKLEPKYTFVADNALHGWAPRYRHVQKRVLEVLCDDGGLLDPDGFPGYYSGAKSRASTFVTSLPLDELTSPPPLDLPHSSGTAGSKTDGKPPVSVSYLKMSEVAVETAGVDMSKWKVDKLAGTAVMNQPWAKVSYKIIAPPAITKEGTELVFEIEATPVPGQRVSVGMVFRGDEVKRDPLDRELSVYVESGSQAVTKKGRKVYKVSIPDYNSSNTIWVGMTDGPVFVYKYTMAVGDPRGGGGPSPAGSPASPTKPANPPGPLNSWAGGWDLGAFLLEGTLSVSPSGKEASGTFGEGQYKLTGTIEGLIMKIRWTDAKGILVGMGELTLSPDGQTVKGKVVLADDPEKTPFFFEGKRKPGN